MQEVTVDGGTQQVSVGNNAKSAERTRDAVFVYFHAANLSWHMTPDEARALGGALIHQAFLIRPMEPPPEMRAPADG